jgi:hypothetical protein
MCGVAGSGGICPDESSSIVVEPWVGTVDLVSSLSSAQRLVLVRSAAVQSNKTITTAWVSRL